MKRSLRLISLLLLLCIVIGSFASCNFSFGGGENPPEHEHVDYVAATKLDMNSPRLRLEVTVKYYIDGDTTHFHVPKSVADDGIFKARYLGVDTPESTGIIEEWGKAASRFTEEKLSSAKSIIIESDSAQWEYDGNGRTLLWIWYQPAEGADYRNLNLELVQEGLGLASADFESTYAEPLWAAYEQAEAEELYTHSDDIDPDYPYDEAVSITLKELRLNTEKYLGKNVAVHGVSTFNSDGTAFIEDYDEETERYYAMQVFYGYTSKLLNLFKQGNELRVVGTVTEFHGTYQINNVQYDIMKPTNPANSTIISTDNPIAYPEATLEQWNGNVKIEDKTYSFQELAVSGSISMTDLVVYDTYTTDNPSSDDCGAITLYCKKGNQNVQIRTGVLKDKNGVVPKEHKDANGVVLASYFDGATIDVKGIVDYFDLDDTGDGTYQIKALLLSNITIK